MKTKEPSTGQQSSIQAQSRLGELQVLESNPGSSEDFVVLAPSGSTPISGSLAEVCAKYVYVKFNLYLVPPNLPDGG